MILHHTDCVVSIAVWICKETSSADFKDTWHSKNFFILFIFIFFMLIFHILVFVKVHKSENGNWTYTIVVKSL